MALRAPLGAGGLLRPLLPLPATALRDYLARSRIVCSEDPTNADDRYDRNYLRHSVLPALLARWPAAAATVARSAAHAAEAAALTQTVAARDAAAAADGVGLDMRVLRRLSPERQRGALRAWVLAQGHPLPDQRRLQQLQSLLHLRGDASPRVHWANTLVQRHGERLLLLQQSQSVPVKALVPLCWLWSEQRSVQWPGAGRLSLRPDRWGDVDLSRLPAQLWLIARQGGERLLTGGQHRDVKDLLREAQIPDWQRAQLPLICAGPGPGPARGSLVALADVALADHIKADANSVRRARFIWQRD
jgi:tRNA(Ile)-lysidine synthase